MIVAVTGFIPIPEHPRSVEEYHKLGEQLFKVDIPLLLLDGDLDMCWLYRYLQGKKFTHSTADNPAKNSVAYHCVQAQKSEWIATAAEFANFNGQMPDILVWIDLGIFHVPGVTAEIIRSFMQRAETEPAIAIPGCWDRNYQYDDRYPMWRYCGGLMVVPRPYASMFDMVMKDEYKRWLKLTGNLSWEVNTLCRVEQRYPELPLWHYKAGHNETMFTLYKSSTGTAQ